MAEARADWQAAEREYQEALKLAPDWAEALVNLGIVNNRQGKTEEAIAAFTRAGAINPKLLGAQLNLWSEVGAGTEVELRLPASVAYGTSQGRGGVRLFRRKDATHV